MRAVLAVVFAASCGFTPGAGAPPDAAGGVSGTLFSSDFLVGIVWQSRLTDTFEVFGDDLRVD